MKKTNALKFFDFFLMISWIIAFTKPFLMTSDSNESWYIDAFQVFSLIILYAIINIFFTFIFSYYNYSIQIKYFSILFPLLFPFNLNIEYLPFLFQLTQFLFFTLIWYSLLIQRKSYFTPKKYLFYLGIFISIIIISDITSVCLLIFPCLLLLKYKETPKYITLLIMGISFIFYIHFALNYLVDSIDIIGFVHKYTMIDNSVSLYKNINFHYTILSFLIIFSLLFYLLFRNKEYFKNSIWIYSLILLLLAQFLIFDKINLFLSIFLLCSISSILVYALERWFITIYFIFLALTFYSIS